MGSGGNSPANQASGPRSEELSSLELREVLEEEGEDLREYLIAPSVALEGWAGFQGLHVRWHAAHGLGRADPMPSEGILAEFYATSYREVMGKARTIDSYLASPNYRAQVRSQVDWLADDPKPEGRWLDVGAGLGLLLWQASQERPGWSFYGFEPDSMAQEGLASRVSLATDFKEFWKGEAFPPAFFDVISLSHVLEHLRDPWTATRTLKEYLKPGGRLLIEVPHDDRQELLRLGRISDLPHLWFFEEQGLVQLAHAAGLEVERKAILGFKRPGVKDRVLVRLRRTMQRRIRGHLWFLGDRDWYCEGRDRSDQGTAPKARSGRTGGFVM